MAIHSSKTVQAGALAGVMAAVGALVTADATMTAVGALLAPPTFDQAGMKAWGQGVATISEFSAKTLEGLKETAAAAIMGDTIADAYQGLDETFARSARLA